MGWDNEEKVFSFQHADELVELSNFLDSAEEILYNPVHDSYEIDGVVFTNFFFAETQAKLTHYLNVIAHVQSKRTVLRTKDGLGKLLGDMEDE